MISGENGAVFTEAQQQYLHGFVAGSSLAQSIRSLPIVEQNAATAEPSNVTDLGRAAQDRVLASGGKLCNEEQAKRQRHGLDTWDMIAEHARDGRFPKGTDVFLFKFQGMFYVAPAQDSFMCRLRFPGGIVRSYQMRGVADMAERLGGGYGDVTTRANLQVRQIKPLDTIHFLQGLADLGIINRGAGADNIRNITASPTAGIDPRELIDTSLLARDLHHTILNHRELYGLPRKFNIAFDGGGAISALEDTNDIGFAAVSVNGGDEPGVYFRLALGGITGHGDFARDTGVMVKPDECIRVALAAVRVFIDHGDRTDRKKARFKYVLDRMGFDGFLAEVDKHLPFKLRRYPLAKCEPRPAVVRNAHVGVHAQKQAGLCYIGVVAAAGRMTAAQMRGLADLADRHGSGTLRLTVWQNLLISDIPAEKTDEVERQIKALDLATEATSVRAGLVACTGNGGCKFAASNTKAHALAIADYMDGRVKLDVPLNIHLTGCPHSCAQHAIGDIGLLAAKVPPGSQEAASDELVEGYHVYIGGGYADQQAIGRELLRDIPAAELPGVIERMTRGYLLHREDGEGFQAFVKRHEIKTLREMFAEEATIA